jgi:DHA1 family bicyclomycin/chloramphenicol resistance-like MFS transporter
VKSNSLSKRRAAILPSLLLAALALKIASMDIYIPCMPFLKQCFATQEWVIQFSLMLSPLMSSLTALFYGRWADVHGRRRTMLFSLAIFTLGSLGCALSNSIQMFLFWRFIQSAGAGGMSILTLVILSDLYRGIAYARYVATYNAMFPFTFAVAPIIGAQLFEQFGWQMNFWFLMVGGLVVISLLYWALDETLPAPSASQDAWRTLYRKSINLVQDSYFLTMSLGHCLPIAVACIYTANSSFLFIDHLDFSPVAFSYIQIIPVSVNFLGAITYRQLLPILGLERSLKIGLGMFFLFVGGAIYCLFFPQSELVILIVLTICLLNFGLPFCNSTCATWAYESMPNARGLAIAWVALIRNGLISGLVMFAALFYNGTITPIFTVMICLSVIVLIILGRGLLLSKRVAIEV